MCVLYISSNEIRLMNSEIKNKSVSEKIDLKISTSYTTNSALEAVTYMMWYSS